MKTHCKSCGKAHEKGKHMKKHAKNTKEDLSKDAKLDRLFHIKEGSPRDEKMDRIEGIKDKKHTKRKSHKKGLKLVAPSKGHKPNGAHGRAAVKELGRTKTTGNFTRIEASKGKGAAIAAFQNARRAHMGK